MAREHIYKTMVRWVESVVSAQKEKSFGGQRTIVFSLNKGHSWDILHPKGRNALTADGRRKIESLGLVTQDGDVPIFQMKATGDPASAKQQVLTRFNLLLTNPTFRSGEDRTKLLGALRGEYQTGDITSLMQLLREDFREASKGNQAALIDLQAERDDIRRIVDTADIVSASVLSLREKAFILVPSPADTSEEELRTILSRPSAPVLKKLIDEHMKRLQPLKEELTTLEDSTLLQ